MTGVVPEMDGRLPHVVLVSERPETRGAEGGVPSPGRRDAQPAGREDAQEMTAREQNDVAADVPDAVHDAIGACPHVCARLSAGAAVTEEIPIGSLGVDVDAG